MSALDFDTYFLALERASTCVRVERASPIGLDRDRFVLEVNGKWIFHLPRGAEARARLQAELELLAVLARELPVPVPSSDAWCSAATVAMR